MTDTPNKQHEATKTVDNITHIELINPTYVTTDEESVEGGCRHGKMAYIWPLLEFNGHSYTGYVKVSRTDPGMVSKHGGSRNSCTDDINFIKEDEEHADVTKEDTYRSGPDRDDCPHHVLDHPEATHE